VREGGREREIERERAREDGVGPAASQRRISSPNGILEEAKKKKDYTQSFRTCGRLHGGGGYVLSFGWYHNAGCMPACMKKRNVMLYDT
jgi:hypothetical protein